MKFKWYYMLPVILFIIFLVFLIFILTLFPRKKIDYSSYSTKPEGTKGLFMLLSELGFNVSRHESPFYNLPGGILIIVEPDYELTEKEIFSLEKWVSQGNCVVFFSEVNNNLYGNFNFNIKKGKSSGIFHPLCRSTLMSDIENIKFSSLSRMDGFMEGMIEYFGDETGSLMVDAPLGRGHVILITDNTLISNESIGNLDNSALIVNILDFYSSEDRHIYFDEYHHGYGSVMSDRKEALWTWMPLYLKVIILQLFLSIFVFLFARSLRFGSPHPLFTEHSGPCQADFVTSMANLFIRTGGRREIARELYLSFKRDFFKKVGIKNQEDYNEIALKVSRHCGLPFEPLLKLIKDTEEKTIMTEKELFDWYKEMKKYRKGFD